MIWLTWRQHRKHAMWFLIGFAALGALLVPSGLAMRAAFGEAGLAACVRLGASAPQSCDRALNEFLDANESMAIAATLLVVLPLLVGLFWGAPLVARELDSGTHRLAWNQSVTRTRWLAVKLVLVGSAAATLAGLVTWAVAWWSDPLDAASVLTPRLPWSMTFSAQGVVPVAHALFAVTLGVAVGMLVRRSLPAMAITLTIFAAIQIAVPLLARPHLVPAVTETVTIAPGNVDGFMRSGPGRTQVVATSPDPGGWLLSSHTIDASGQRVEDLPFTPESSPACGPGEGVDTCTAAIERLGYRQVSTYHPRSHFWPMQWTEAGLFAGLTAATVGFCFWWLRRRVA
jgi:hypothetical protein